MVAASVGASSPLDSEPFEAGFLVLLTRLGLFKIEPRMAYIRISFHNSERQMSHTYLARQVPTTGIANLDVLVL